LNKFTLDRFEVITPDGLLNKFTLDGVLSHSSNQENSTIKPNTECIKNMPKLDCKGERTETKQFSKIFLELKKCGKVYKF
jgi:hypothetical protein